MVLNLKQQTPKQNNQTKRSEIVKNWQVSAPQQTIEPKFTNNMQIQQQYSNLLGSLTANSTNNIPTNQINPFLTSNLLNLLTTSTPYQQAQQAPPPTQNQQNPFSNLMGNTQPPILAQNVNSANSNDMNKMLENLINYSNYMKMIGNGFQIPSNFSTNISTNLPNRPNNSQQTSQSITSEQQAVLNKLSALSNAAL
jgi:hypothetical protein